MTPGRYLSLAVSRLQTMLTTRLRQAAEAGGRGGPADIDATGQPMSPDPFQAVQNAIEHYKIDEVLISTFAGEGSRWLEDDLIGRVREITEKQVQHIEVSRTPTAVAAAVAEEGGA